MKYLTYILRNARRNPMRTILTIASTSICLSLMMILVSFFAVYEELDASTRIYNRIITLNANGFEGMVPIARVQEIARLEGVEVVTPFGWYGGKYQDEIVPFAQFAVDPDAIFRVMTEFVVPPDQLKAFQENKDGCVIGRKLAEEKQLKVGDSLPLKGDAYPVNLNLRICGTYDGPSNRDLRMCLFRFDYFDEALKRAVFRTSSALTARSVAMPGDAGMIFARCKAADVMAGMCKKIDDLYRNSDFPTRTQTEEAFGKMFDEMMGDLKGVIRAICMAVVFSLLCVAGNVTAMSMRERTSEVALLKAIGFDRGRILVMVLSEAVLVAGVGGAIGSLGCKAFCEMVDISRYSGGFLPFYYIPWSVALQGLAGSLFVGFAGGLYPAARAASLSVVDGLRTVI